MPKPQRCPHCRHTDPTPVHVTRCAFEAALFDDLLAHAKTLDKPPTEAQISDLYAHARDIYGDIERAVKFTRAALDLGWRVSVGSKR